MDTKAPPTRETIEAIADKIGAPTTSVLKWRRRGIPGAWALKIIVASEGAITAQDMIAFSEGYSKQATPSPVVAREGAAA